MTSDNIQQIFECPKCGAQNIVGQQVCQACGQKFQYNCPYCGFVVDPTLVNCPNCRERLYWPTPHRVKAFPKKQAGVYQEGEEVGGEQEAKPRKGGKSDPWLIGCLALIVIVVCIAAAIFFIDRSSQPKPSLMPPKASSGNQTGLSPMWVPEIELRQVANSIMIKESGVIVRGG